MYLKSKIDVSGAHVRDKTSNDFADDVYALFNSKLKYLLFKSLFIRHINIVTISKLKWLLEHTMGCEKTFENRRKELELLGPDSSDAAVLQNFIDRSSNSFLSLIYLLFISSLAFPGRTASFGGTSTALKSLASSAILYSSTVPHFPFLFAILSLKLFHLGAVSEISLNFIPSDANKDGRQTFDEVKGRELQDSHTVQQWVDELNSWYFPFKYVLCLSLRFFKGANVIYKLGRRLPSGMQTETTEAGAL